MAEHVLKLKAQLDTSQVKAELASLGSSGSAAEIDQVSKNISKSLGKLDQSLKDGSNEVGRTFKNLSKLAGLALAGNALQKSGVLPDGAKPAAAILQGAATGGMMGGPWGAAIGAFTAAIAQLATVVNAEREKFAESLSNLSKAVEMSLAKIKTVVGQMDAYNTNVKRSVALQEAGRATREEAQDWIRGSSERRGNLEEDRQEAEEKLRSVYRELDRLEHATVTGISSPEN